MIEEPLLKGRPVRLYVLDFGMFRVHANRREIGICGFLIATDAGEHVLVDGGFPAKYAEDPQAAALEDTLGLFGEVLSLTPDNLPVPQMARARVRPEDVDLMILTHSHIDHLGALELCPRAPMLVPEAERSLPRPLYWGDVQPLGWPEREYVAVTGDRQIGPGLTVLCAPGHAPGQMALLVELPETGPVLLTSDAISRPEEIDEGFDTAPDPETAQASAARLMALAEEAGAFVIYGHDPAQWPELRKAPDFYD